MLPLGLLPVDERVCTLHFQVREQVLNVVCAYAPGRLLDRPGTPKGIVSELGMSGKGPDL